MNKFKEYWALILLALLLLAFNFYWHEIRPVKLTQKCIKTSGVSYKFCLIDKGYLPQIGSDN